MTNNVYHLPQHEPDDAPEFATPDCDQVRVEIDGVEHHLSWLDALTPGTQAVWAATEAMIWRGDP